MTEQEAIKDLKFIRDAYKNLSENGTDRYRAVGKGIDCSVKIETNTDLYGHYTEALEMAIEVLEKQAPKKPQKILLPYGTGYECRECGNELSVNSFNVQYCHWCGQRIDWE